VRLRRGSYAAFALCLSLQCKPSMHITLPPAAAPAEQVALSGASAMVGVGDIASCSQRLGVETAILVDSILRADSVAKVQAAVFTLGDNVYSSGTTEQFEKCFTPAWGDPKRRIMKSLHPTPGNHEYYTPNADPYYKYFGPAAGVVGKGYYSYEVAKWHVVVVNSELFVNSIFSDSARKEQLEWVAQDLKEHKALCTIAYWHHPRFSSGWHGNDARFDALWRILYSDGVDLVLNGHDHDYERFAPVNPAGILDCAKGIAEIVAGTGGEDLRGFNTIVPNSVYRIEGRVGVLLLTLGDKEWRSAWVEVGGRVWDQAGGKCH
jgi:acid phosphatase type 7